MTATQVHTGQRDISQGKSQESPEESTPRRRKHHADTRAVENDLRPRARNPPHGKDEVGGQFDDGIQARYPVWIADWGQLEWIPIVKKLFLGLHPFQNREDGCDRANREKENSPER